MALPVVFGEGEYSYLLDRRFLGAYMIGPVASWCVEESATATKLWKR